MQSEGFRRLLDLTVKGGEMLDCSGYKNSMRFGLAKGCRGQLGALWLICEVHRTRSSQERDHGNIQSFLFDISL